MAFLKKSKAKEKPKVDKPELGPEQEQSPIPAWTKPVEPVEEQKEEEVTTSKEQARIIGMRINKVGIYTTEIDSNYKLGEIGELIE